MFGGSNSTDSNITTARYDDLFRERMDLWKRLDNWKKCDRQYIEEWFRDSMVSMFKELLDHPKRALINEIDSVMSTFKEIPVMSRSGRRYNQPPPTPPRSRRSRSPSQYHSRSHRSRSPPRHRDQSRGRSVARAPNAYEQAERYARSKSRAPSPRRNTSPSSRRKSRSRSPPPPQLPTLPRLPLPTPQPASVVVLPQPSSSSIPSKKEEKKPVAAVPSKKQQQPNGPLIISLAGKVQQRNELKAQQRNPVLKEVHPIKKPSPPRAAVSTTKTLGTVGTRPIPLTTSSDDDDDAAQTEMNNLYDDIVAQGESH